MMFFYQVKKTFPFEMAKLFLLPNDKILGENELEIANKIPKLKLKNMHLSHLHKSNSRWSKTSNTKVFYSQIV